MNPIAFLTFLFLAGLFGLWCRLEAAAFGRRRVQRVRTEIPREPRA